MRRLFIASLVLCGAAWGTACPVGYNFTIPIAIPPQVGMTADQSNFPMYWNGSATFATVANGGDAANSPGTGVDIVFCDAASSGNLLAYELVGNTYSATLGTGEWWIKLPTLSHTVTVTIYVFVGKTGGTDQSSVSGTWSNSFVSVWHLRDGTTLDLADSLAANNCTGANTPTATAGQIDGAMAVASASSQSAGCGTSSTLFPASVTISAWGKATSFPQSYNSIIDMETGSGGYTIIPKSTGKMAVYFDGCCNYDGTGGATLATATNFLLGATFDGANLKGWVNGANDGSSSGGAYTAPTGATFFLGKSSFASRLWNGVIDEARVSNVARSADWMLAEYNNQFSPTTFYAINPASYPTASCPAGYGFSVSITVNPPAGTSLDQSNFPMYFKANGTFATVANGGKAANSPGNGTDIIFCDAISGGHLLNYELVSGSYTASTGIGEWWIEIPTAPHTGTAVIYALLGKTGASDQSNAAGTWSNGFLAVWHFGTSGSFSTTDSTGNQTLSNTAVTATAGEVGGAGSYNGTTSQLTTASGSALAVNTGTATVWVNRNVGSCATNSSCGYVGNATTSNGWLLRNPTTSAGLDSLKAFNSSVTDIARDTASLLSTGVWAVAGMTWTGGINQLFVNGTLQSTAQVGNGAGTSGTSAANFAIGNNTTFGGFVAGLIDEVEISSVVRPADWLLDQFNNQSSPATFYTIGSAAPINTNHRRAWVISK